MVGVKKGFVFHTETVLEQVQAEQANVKGEQEKMQDGKQVMSKSVQEVKRFIGKDINRLKPGKNRYKGNTYVAAPKDGKVNCRVKTCKRPRDGSDDEKKKNMSSKGSTQHIVSSWRQSRTRRSGSTHGIAAKNHGIMVGMKDCVTWRTESGHQLLCATLRGRNHHNTHTHTHTQHTSPVSRTHTMHDIRFLYSSWTQNVRSVAQKMLLPATQRKVQIQPDTNSSHSSHRASRTIASNTEQRGTREIPEVMD